MTINAADRTFTYELEVGFAGIDSFTFELSDGSLTSNEAEITLSVINVAPSASGSNYSIAHRHDPDYSDLDASLGASDADGDDLSYTIEISVEHGSLTIDPDGTFTYEPNVGFIGTDSFSYKASDGIASSEIATITIDVQKTHVTYQVYRIQDGSEEGTVLVKYKPHPQKLWVKHTKKRPRTSRIT